MKWFPALLLSLLCPLLSATDFGSEKEGYTLKLSGDWKSGTFLTRLIGQGSTKLTAFKDLSGKTPLVAHLLSMEAFGNLAFNRQATFDALSADPKTIGGVRNTTIKIGGLDAARLEYRRSGKKIIQYLLVANGHLWSLMFVGPEKMTADQLKAIDADAASFRIRAKTQ